MSLAYVRPAGRAVEFVFQSDEPNARPQVHVVSALQALRIAQGALDEAVRLLVVTPSRNPDLDDYPR